MPMINTNWAIVSYYIYILYPYPSIHYWDIVSIQMIHSILFPCSKAFMGHSNCPWDPPNLPISDTEGRSNSWLKGKKPRRYHG